MLRPSDLEVNWLKTRLFKLGVPIGDDFWEILLLQYRRYINEKEGQS